MDEGVRALVVLSAALASGDRARLEVAMGLAAAVADPVAVEEALLQSYLFLGYPAALNALGRWRERTGRPAGPPTATSWPAWERAGQAACVRVYGDQYERLRANVASIHPDLDRWMIAEGYGKVLSRPGLGLKERELCVAALLAVSDAPRQLYSHLRGALNVGATEDEVSSALEAALAEAAPDRRETAQAIWAEVRARRVAGGSETDAGAS